MPPVDCRLIFQAAKTLALIGILIQPLTCRVESVLHSERCENCVNQMQAAQGAYSSGLTWFFQVKPFMNEMNRKNQASLHAL